jgi:hypothetical protein
MLVAISSARAMFVNQIRGAVKLDYPHRLPLAFTTQYSQKTDVQTRNGARREGALAVH